MEMVQDNKDRSWAEEDEFASLPKLFATVDVPPLDRVIYEEFQGPCQSRWFAAEYDPNERLFYGYIVINKDVLRGSWGYFSYKYLQSLENPGAWPPALARISRGGRYPKAAVQVPDIAAGYRLRGEWDSEFHSKRGVGSNEERWRFRRLVGDLDKYIGSRSRPAERS